MKNVYYCILILLFGSFCLVMFIKDKEGDKQFLETEIRGKINSIAVKK